MSASNQTFRFILSLRLYSSFITSRPGGIFGIVPYFFFHKINVCCEQSLEAILMISHISFEDELRKEYCHNHLECMRLCRYCNSILETIVHLKRKPCQLKTVIWFITINYTKIHDWSSTRGKSGFVACEQMGYIIASATAQSGQRLCYSIPGKYDISTCYTQNFNILASLCSGAGRFESSSHASRFSRFEHNFHCIKLFISAASISLNK